MHSFETIPKAKENTANKTLNKTLSKGGFNLTKFVSNEQSTIKKFSDSKENDEDYHRVLGVHWNKSTDIVFQKLPAKFDNNADS